MPLPPGSLPRFPQPGLDPPEQETDPLSTVEFIMPCTQEGLSECLSNECMSECMSWECREPLKKEISSCPGLQGKGSEVLGSEKEPWLSQGEPKDRD